MSTEFDTISQGGEAASTEARDRSYFFALETLDDLEAVFSAEATSVVFLRDPWCPISTHADDELYAAGLMVLTVDVSGGRELSERIQSFTGIRHESPQVIVLRNGSPLWHASHYGITREAVRAAVREATR